ncbi:aminodeoxychorismate/anthranilate synthase component II [Candidatus Vidania fulgoroideae]|uniref:Aminodeoxychorismate/anthranilate synthase component II n=1 Tax=Candidatus Vidania fulgoroideorum TaxID=881286 RepID=A0A974X801_9PROT|nr:aminodeoxychorismate/anthranilate synthase component II [Candidatus Vidania fulgoroideae]
MILLIDNYDSFTFNVFELLNMFRRKVEVTRNIKSIKNIRDYKMICIGPGTGKPENYKVIKRTIKKNYKHIPIIGICLGHQIIGNFFKLKIRKVKRIEHGLIRKIKLVRDYISIGIPEEISVIKYNSLSVQADKNVSDIKIVSMYNKEVMIMRHKIYPILGLQFHPDSFVCRYGRKIIRNFVNKHEIF